MKLKPFYMGKKHRIKEILTWSAFSVLVLALITGCAPKKIEQDDPFFTEWKARAEKSPGYSPSSERRTIDLPEKETAAFAKPKVEAELEKPLPAEKTSLVMHKTDVAVLLRALAKAAKQNIMISENVQGRISINVEEVPWDQVFRSILRTQGLTYAWEGDIIRIITLEDKKKSLSQLETDKKIRSKEREIEMTEPLFTKVVQVNYADASKLQENLKRFLTEKEEGKPLGSVMVDVHTNSLIIQSIRSDIQRMIPLIEELDKPTPQILIEAHIVGANKEVARELGIQWGGLSHGGDVWVYPGARSEGVFGNQLSDGGIDPTSAIAANFPAALEDSFGLTIGFAVEKIGKQILAVQLSALEEEGKLEIISSPSITTLDNQAAYIEAGTDVPYQAIQGTGANQTVSIQYKKAVLSLQVTPHVVDGKTLKLDILTTKDDVDFTNQVQGNPTIITRKAETKVVLFDGQTTVIGGLNEQKTAAGEAGVPWLKDLPGLGYLFKGTEDRSEIQDVLIFITPHILEQRKEKPVLGKADEKPSS
jgi:type IV pilus assembly protein PilQ